MEILEDRLATSIEATNSQSINKKLGMGGPIETRVASKLEIGSRDGPIVTTEGARGGDRIIETKVDPPQK